MSPVPKKVVIFNVGGEDVVISEADDEQQPPPQEQLKLLKEFLRLESLLRSHVQHQWHLSIENYRFSLLLWHFLCVHTKVLILYICRRQ